MKTLYPITSLFLILSIGCSDSVKQAEIEAKQVEERQRSMQLMQETFLAASICLRPVPIPPLVVTDILCSPCREAERSDPVLTPGNNVELAASGRRTEGELERPTDN